MTEISDDWAAFKARLIRSLGREGAAEWLAYASEVLRREHRIEEARKLERATVAVVR